MVAIEQIAFGSLSALIPMPLMKGPVHGSLNKKDELLESNLDWPFKVPEVRRIRQIQTD